MASSLQDIIDQMAEAGITGLSAADLAADGRYHRFRPDEERKKKKSAWYILFEHTTKSGKQVFNGAFGRGPDTFKLRPSDTGFSVEDRAELARARKAAEKAAAELRKSEAEKAAEKAARLWGIAHEEGASAYLERKQVRAFGLRFLNGSALVPVRDADGRLSGCQYIDAEGGKRFNTGMDKVGRFHLLGDANKAERLLFAEGYATAASLHMSTGWPVVATFDAGNMEPVAATLRQLYLGAQFVFCGDDDRHLRRRLRERLHKLGVPADLEPDGTAYVLTTEAGEIRVQAAWENADGARRIALTVQRAGAEARTWYLENAGRKVAQACARKFAGVAVFPAFAAGDSDGTDWNDLHLAEGLGVVRSQVVNALQAAAEAAADPKRARARGAAAEAPAEVKGQVSKVLEHWALIYPTDTMWDGFKRRIMKVAIAKVHYGPLVVDQWLASPDRRTVMDRDVVFDPALKHDPATQINLFDGWPLKPDRTKTCEKLIAHLYDLCDEDDGLFRWVVSWLAFPLQNPGAKMRTALIVHGPEGTGKSILFDVIRLIYGECGRMATQLQLQSEYTDWLSKMLFCVAEEVVTRQELRHHKGLLKNLITNPVVNINEKYMPLRTERNQANFTFLSNEINPMALDEGDRRYTVIWYEPKRSYDEGYFKSLGDEIANGGAEALYAWLLDQDLSGFNEHTRPYETRARRELIQINMPPRDRFHEEWKNGLIADLDYGPARVCDVYAAFKRWCATKGERFIDNEATFGRMLGRHMFKGVKQGSVSVWDKIEEKGYFEKVKARQKWRGTVVVPKDWTPKVGTSDEREEAMWTAVRGYQDGLELYLQASRQLLAA